MKVLIATSNKNKMREILSMLPQDSCEYISLNEIDTDPIDPVEDGRTFEENAVKKAQEFSKYYGMPVIAEDSGLSVDMLDGAPGIYAARYSGVTGSKRDSANIKKLLAALKDVPENKRQAHFICHMVLVNGDDVLISVEGRVDGLITYEPCGTGGFGYDPVFFYPPMKKTFAEINLEEKNRVSHRFKALEQLASRMREIS